MRNFWETHFYLSLIKSLQGSRWLYSSESLTTNNKAFKEIKKGSGKLSFQKMVIC